MKIFFLCLSFLMISCTMVPKQANTNNAGASAAQAATQEAADDMSNPAMPATQQPPAGTINIQPMANP